MIAWSCIRANVVGDDEPSRYIYSKFCCVLGVYNTDYISKSSFGSLYTSFYSIIISTSTYFVFCSDSFTTFLIYFLTIFRRLVRCSCSKVSERITKWACYSYWVFIISGFISWTGLVGSCNSMGIDWLISWRSRVEITRESFIIMTSSYLDSRRTSSSGLTWMTSWVSVKWWAISSPAPFRDKS